MDPTVARIMAHLKAVQDSGMSFVEYVRLKKQELEDLTDALAELEKLSTLSPDLALTTPSGRARRIDAGKPRAKKGDDLLCDQPQLPAEPPMDSPTE